MSFNIRSGFCNESYYIPAAYKKQCIFPVSDFFQLGKTCKHLFCSCSVKVYCNLVISSTLYDVLYDSHTEFYMANRIAHSVVKTVCFFT